SRVIRIRLPHGGRVWKGLLISIVIVLCILVGWNLFGSESGEGGGIDSIAEPGRRALLLNVKENISLVRRLEQNQREIHQILKDEPELFGKFKSDSEPPYDWSRPSAMSMLRANADYAGIYSGFFREIPHRWPLRLDFLKLNSGYGSRGAVFGFLGQSEFHPGFDLNAVAGTPVLAAADGVVKLALSSSYGYGNHVVILHSSGYETLYGHLRSISVKKGQEVRASQEIGKSGSSGASTGPHLHYEIRFAGKTVHPGDFLVF
ncbi:MAG TPA: M23 family metallopeptidase, partial [Leptospiraceae bacterium]|nr:M23 family metallopeptidase [Leptospiraceae bacterium]